MATTSLVPRDKPAPDAARHANLVLATLCAGTFTIMLATSTMNIALPALVTDLQASTRDLQWIVDGYNLAFASFVLAFGSLSDRYGRKGALILGLAVFAGAAMVGSTADSTAQLTAAQVVMGLGAALIFPTTLSIISNVFTGRAARAKAIGIWGAAAGLGAGFGPMIGGAMTDIWSWRGSLLLLMALAAGVAALSARYVHTSRDPSTPRLDLGGLALSVLAVGSLVFTIIEAPKHGWGSTETLAGFAVSLALFAALIGWELRSPEPMLDVRLFANPRFSAASGSLAFVYFAIFGFIFLGTQYLQFVLGYSPFEAGLRIAPFAVAMGVGSVVGTVLAVRIGNKLVVTAGLVLLAFSFAWISVDDTSTGYLVIVLQVVPMGLGAGLTSAPATEAIMGEVPKEKAGIGSAMNDATREFGGTLGVAVVGSIQASLYATSLADSSALAALPESVRGVAGDSLGAAQQVIAGIGDPALADAVAQASSDAFLSGFSVGCLVVAGVCTVGAILTAWLLPARPAAEAEQLAPAPAAGPPARLRGRVRGPAGQPIGGALVTVHAVDGTVLASCRSGPNGHFDLAELPAGAHRVDVVQSLVAEQAVHVGPGAEEEIELRLGGATTLPLAPALV
ncbi:MAG: MFS transporter [Sporichthyaceae bacterium]